VVFMIVRLMRNRRTSFQRESMVDINQEVCASVETAFEFPIEHRFYTLIGRQ
jgi:hypothetical protein